jgi:hypothetical protein
VLEYEQTLKRVWEVDHMEFPKTRAQRRYEHIARSMVQTMAELTESQLIELYEIALRMFADRHGAEKQLYQESKRRAGK